MDNNHILILGGAQWDSNFKPLESHLTKSWFIRFTNIGHHRRKKSYKIILIFAINTTCRFIAEKQVRMTMIG